MTRAAFMDADDVIAGARDISAAVADSGANRATIHFRDLDERTCRDVHAALDYQLCDGDEVTYPDGSKHLQWSGDFGAIHLVLTCPAPASEDAA